MIKNALQHDGLARGLRECAKALDKCQAHLCVLVETCSEAEYIKLIEALCADHKINLIKVADPKLLGELLLGFASQFFHIHIHNYRSRFPSFTTGTWAGLCKIDKEGNPRKVVGCTCVVVKDYGVDSEGMHVLLEYFRTRA